MCHIILQVKVTIKASSEYVIRKRQEDNQVIQRDEVMWLDVRVTFCVLFAGFLRKTVFYLDFPPS